MRGVWGFHGTHKPHGDKLFQLARRVPVTSEIVPAAVSLNETQCLGDITLAQHDY
jgi:PII-like signaling protein